MTYDEQMAQFAAEDARIAAECAAERRYDELIIDLTAIENRVNAERRAAGNYDFFFLADTNVDIENIEGRDLINGSVEYWEALYAAACCAAGGRADYDNFDVNAALGRVIY